MKPLTVALILENQRLRSELLAALANVPVRVVLDQGGFESETQIREKLANFLPDVLFVDLSDQPEERFAFVRSVRAMVRPPAVAVCHRSSESAIILAAMRAGAAEFLAFPLEEGALESTLERISALAPGRDVATRAGGKVLAFLAAKGGGGATTLACSVAASLGGDDESEVLLADLDLETGNVAFAMKAPSHYSILDACRNLSRLDNHYWRGLVSNGLPGLHVLTAPAGFSGLDAPQGVEVRQVLNFARGIYRYIVVDLASSLNRLSLAVLEDADRVFVITTGDLPAVHVAKRSLHALHHAGYPMDRVSLVLNRVSRRDPVAPEDLERNLKIDVFWRFPNDVEGANEFYVKGGVLPPKSDLGKSVRQFVHKLGGRPVPKGRSFLGL